MAIEVRIPTILRQYTGGAKSVEASGRSLGSLVDDLDAQHPGIRSRLVTEDGKLEYANVYVAGEDIRTRDGIETPVSAGDTVILLPTMAGGS